MIAVRADWELEVNQIIGSARHCLESKYESGKTLMKKTSFSKTIFLIAILALMQIIIFAQKAELVVQTGHTSFISSVVFSPDGKKIVSGSGDDTIKLWDLTSGQEIRTYTGHIAAVYSVAFSPDGKTIASASEDNTIKLWDVESGRELKTIKEDVFYVTSVTFSPSGKTLASASRDQTIKLWDAESGMLVKTIKEDVFSIAFSPNGKTLASGNFDNTIKLWDVESGTLIKTFEGHTNYVDSIAFSPDGKTLASGSYDDSVRVWDVESGTLIRTFTGHTEDVVSIAFSPDGKTIASGSRDGTVKLWNVESGTIIKTLERNAYYAVTSVTFSPNGKTLASASRDRTIKLWDVESGTLIKTFEEHTSDVTALAISQKGKIFASASNGAPFATSFDNTIKLWSLESGIIIKTLKGHFENVDSLAFSPDGKILASGGHDDTVRVWDVESGTLIKTLEGHRSYVASLAFSPDGKTLASGSRDETIKLWDVESGTIIKTLEGHASLVFSVAFSPNGKTLASANLDETIKLWNVESGQELKSLPSEDDATTREVQSIVPNLYINYDKPVMPDGRFQVKKDANGKLDLYDFKSGKLLASLVALDENDWAVVDPEGRFDASPGAQKLMHFVVGLEPVDLEQIKDRYYTPNLLQRIFKGENLDATRKVSVFTADELYPLAEYAPLKADETVVNVKLQNRGGGIGRVQVFVNGAEFLADARPKGFDPKSKTAEFKIDFSAAKTLKKGEQNEINIIARNEAGWLRNRGTEIVYLDDRKKDDAPQEFYAIIGGVSEYENNAFNLRYSAKDARDFARATELGAVKLFGRDHVHIRLLASGADSENAVLTGADSKRLAPTKENFKKTFEEFRQAKPTDVFVVYLAGHGTSINRGGDTGDTYLYLTQEAVTTDKSRLLDDKLRNATTVSSEELAEWIRDVPALKRAMILDTCAAGAVEASLTKARDLSPDQIKALDRMKDRTGFYVLMGSAADAQSYEATRYGQGLLTYSLLQGMSGAKLRDGEYADVSTLFNYAEDTVTEMAKGIGGIQQPRIIAPTESRSFDIGRFSTVEKGKFTLAKVKPLILQPQLSNDKLKFDNLKLSQMVAKALRDESSTIARGDAEAKLVFVEAEEMNDAVTPGGVYEITGDRIKVTLILVRNNEPVKTVTVEGGAADKEELSRKIVAAIIANAPN